MTEKSIQDALYYFRHQQKHRFIIPNAVMRWGEVDLLTITKDALAVEHEIKISRSDFRADRDKIAKHLALAGSGKTRLADGTRDGAKCPNYFFYVVPENLIKLEDIPPYAGLIYVPKFGNCEIKKRAPRLHEKTLDGAILVKLAEKLIARYWSMRLQK